MVRKDVQFVNARRMAHDHPDWFKVPSLQDLRRLTVARLVKVCAYGERFWVQILHIDGEWITGRVDNNLLTEELAFDDLVEFHIKHIYQIYE